MTRRWSKFVLGCLLAAGCFLSSSAFATLQPPTPTCSKGAYSSYVHVSWSYVSGATTGYVIWRGTSSNFNYAQRMTTTAAGVTSWNDWNVSTGTTYYYWVCPRDSSYTWWYNTSRWDTGWAQYVYVPTPYASWDTYTYVHLTWPSSSTEKTGYVIWRNTSSNFNTAQRMTTTSHGVTYWNDYSATRGKTYYYWVCPRDANYTWWYNTSNWDIGRAKGIIPPTPTCSQGAYSSYVHVSWSSVSGATTGYVIWRNTSSNFNTATRMTTTAAGVTSWNDWSANSGTTYYYWVCPRDSSYTWWYDTSKWGKGWSQYVYVPTPYCSWNTYTYIHLTWSSSSTEKTGYVIWRNTSSNFNTAQRMTTTSHGQTYWNDYSATPGVTYYYWVCPRDANYTWWYNTSNWDIGKAKTIGLPVPIPTVYGYSGYNRVLWSSISGATTGYVIFRNTSSSFSSATRMTTVSAGTTAWNDWSATPYVTYYYWVCPRDSNYTYWYNTTAYDWNWCTY